MLRKYVVYDRIFPSSVTCTIEIKDLHNSLCRCHHVMGCSVHDDIWKNKSVQAESFVCVTRTERGHPLSALQAAMCRKKMSASQAVLYAELLQLLKLSA